MFPKIKNLLDNKNILILGFGREGRSTLRFLREYVDYKSLTVADRNFIEDFSFNDVNVLFGEHYMSTLDTYDIIVKSPGIPYISANESIIKKTISQTDLFLLEYSDNTIGITGTKGKSTTTTLIHHILSVAHKNPVLLGNIGIPPLDVIHKMNEESIAVFEMSCHQLEYTDISPRVAVIINIFEDHLDHYGTREKYVKAKENIFLHQNKNDIFIINNECLEQIEKAESKVIRVGYDSSCEYCLTDKKINDAFYIPQNISLIGKHNDFNIALAYAVTKLYDVSDDVFEKSLFTYKPLPHRLEFVATKYGVDYYDDSISTIPQTTIQAIKSLENVKTVILGGMDRGIDYSELVEYLQKKHIDNIILLPGAGERIGIMLKKCGISFNTVKDLQEAVLKSKELTEKGGKCVLSPAAASYGYYKNFEERGDAFKDMVNNL